MSEKEKQHLVSKTFLKNFVVPSYKHQNHVWCIDYYDKYKKHPVAKGINQDVFKIKNFYSLNEKENKLLLEDFYGQKLEPIYNLILKEVNEEVNLSEKIRLRLIEWIMHSNFKTENFRKNTEQIAEFFIDVYSNFGDQQKEFKEKYNENSASKIAKELQIELVLKPLELEENNFLYFKELTTKKWTILKSLDKNPFIANDNPGFSLNTSHLGKNIFNKTIQLNTISFNYFILNPKYCLFIEPFKSKDDKNLNALNMEIEYHKITDQQIDFINEGTSKTALRYIISNDFDTITKWIL